MTAIPLRIARQRPEPPASGGELVAAWVGQARPATAAARRASLACWCGFCGTDQAAAVARLLAGPEAVGNGLLSEFLAWLRAGGLSPATVAVRLACIRSLLSAARRLGLARWRPERLPGSPKPLPYRDLSGPTEADVRALLVVADGPRDRALVLLLATTGLRRAAVARLGVADLVREDGQVVAVLAAEKGRQEQAVRFGVGPVCGKELAKAAGTVGPTAPLFGLSYSGIGKRLKGLARKAGVSCRANPHAFRHTAITNCYELTHDPVAVQRFAGHKNVNTTMVYVDHAERRAAGLAGRLESRLTKEAADG